MMAVSETKTQVALLHQISNIVSSDLTLEKMLQELIGLAVDVTDCDACLVYLVEHNSNEIVLRASQLPHTSEIDSIRLKMGEGITGWVAQRRSVNLAGLQVPVVDGEVDRRQGKPMALRILRVHQQLRACNLIIKL